MGLPLEASTMGEEIVNTWRRKLLAVLAVALLGVPAAMGVYKALEPTRGPWAAGLAAAGFELVYISTAILILTPELRAYARRVAVSAVATSVLLNTLADYAHRVPAGLASWERAQQLFDPLALGLSIAESLPLAGLAYAMAELLHRLAEVEAGEPQAPRPPRVRRRWAWLGWRRGPVTSPTPMPAGVHIANTSDEPVLQVGSNTSNTEPVRAYACRHCGAGDLTKAEQLAHGRQHARERQQLAPAGD